MSPVDSSVAKFSADLRAAITQSGYSLTWLRRLLADRGVHVSVSSLSHWQSGRSLPEKPASLEAVAEIEDILELPPGRLRNLLLVPRPRHRSFRASQSPEVRAAVDLVRSIERRLGGGILRSHELTVFERLELGVRPGVHVLRQTAIIEAVTPGLLRQPAIHRFGPGESGSGVSYRSIVGCEIGEEVSIEGPDGGLIRGLDLRIGELETGQRALYTYEMWVHDAPVEVFTGIDYTVTRRAHDITLEVVFGDELEPRDIEGTVGRGAELEEWSPLSIGTGGRVQLTSNDFGPGSVEIRWAW